MPIDLLPRARDMEPVPGGSFPIGLTGFNTEDRVDVRSFLIDRDEVTNKDFKRFVDSSG